MSRAHLSFSRGLEFASEGELIKRMGCPQSLWFRATLKELIDNALDAAEELGVAPVIKVEIDGHMLTVSDNGPGMPPELVARLCERAERTSSREAYAAPDRGAQGNALQTIACLPFAWGQEETRMVIESQEVRHEIVHRVNRLAGAIEVERSEQPSLVHGGTDITLAWPTVLDEHEAGVIVSPIARFNPHAEIHIGDKVWLPRGEVRKWTADEPVPPQWYTCDRLAHRILLEIRRDPSITVAQFLGTFRGLSDRSKRARVAEAAGVSYQPLTALLDGTTPNEARIEHLRLAMCAQTKPPRPEAMGGVGKEWAYWALTLEGREGAHTEPHAFAYHTLSSDDRDVVPWRWEVAFGYLPELPRSWLLVGQNHSPSIAPDQALPWHSLLPNMVSEADPIALFVHRLSPRHGALDYGKITMDLPSEERWALQDALEKLTARWVRERERELRQRARVIDRARRLSARVTPRGDRVTLRDAVWDLIEDAYLEASSKGTRPVRARQIYYAIRPKVLAATDKEKFSDSYFSSNLLPRFMQENPKVTGKWRVLFDPRGTLIEPHTYHRVAIGTEGFESYRSRWTNGEVTAWSGGVSGWDANTVGPRHRFSAVIVVEKEGIADLLIADRLHHRHDVAVAGLKGQPTEAALKLADQLGLSVFVLHDFDRAGLTIAANIRDGTWRHRYTNDFPVIDVGLRLDQIDGLEDEPIDRDNLRSVGDDRLRECGATEDEIAFLATRRVELNALTTEALVKLVEDALTAHGVAKVVPGADDLEAAWREAQVAAEIAHEIALQTEAARERWQGQAAPDDLDDRVRELLDAQPELSWDDAIREIADGDD